MANVSPGRYELPPDSSFEYSGFVDPSGGGPDAMVLAIGHKEGSKFILDSLKIAKAPHDPHLTTSQFAEILREYRVNRVFGDRYSGEWVKQAFMQHGITYETTELNKSQIYLEFQPMLTRNQCELLDNRQLVAELGV